VPPGRSNSRPASSCFYDGFAFWTPHRGILHGDSINGVFHDFRTLDGMTWHDISANMPPALPGEAPSRQAEPISQRRWQERVDSDRRRGDCQGTGLPHDQGLGPVVIASTLAIAATPVAIHAFLPLAL